MDDLISRDALLQDMTHRGGLDIGDWYIFDLVNEQPAIEAEPVKHGRWVLNHHGVVVCTECRSPQQIGAKDFCGTCGAKMDGGLNNG